MSPNEYKAMIVDFEKALAKKCKDESIPYRKINASGNNHYYLLGLELYVLTHDGEKPRWSYAGIYA